MNIRSARTFVSAFSSSLLRPVAYARVSVAIVLVVSSVAKISDLIEPAHIGAITGMRWLRFFKIPGVAVTLSVVEFIAGIGLLTPAWRRFAGPAFFLNAAFAIVFSLIVFAGLPSTACGCFGGFVPSIGAHTILIVASIVLARGLWVEATRPINLVS